MLVLTKKQHFVVDKGAHRFKLSEAQAVLVQFLYGYDDNVQSWDGFETAVSRWLRLVVMGFAGEPIDD